MRYHDATAPISTLLTTLAVAVAAVAALSAAITFTSTFKSLDAGSVSFAGKKVAALVISNDDSLRVAGEESLVRELNARGHAGGRDLPYRAEGRTAPRGDGQALVRESQGGRRRRRCGPVSADTRQTYTPGTWVSANYGTLWGYYGYGWGAVYVPGAAQKETSSSSKPRSTACRATS